MGLTTIVLATVAGVLAFLAFHLFQQARALRKRYSKIIDLDNELATRRKAFEEVLDADRRRANEAITEEENALRQQQADIEAQRRAATTEIAVAEHKLQQLKAEQQQVESQNIHRRNELTSEYQTARDKYRDLQKEISLLEENLEDISFGLYKPHFSFQASEDYKAALERLRNEQRTLIREGRAAVCAVRWTVGDDAKAGERMAKQYTKLLTRAFNGECDAAIANVTWNNATKMEERILKCFRALNELGGVMQMSLTSEFLNMRLNELRLTHEYEQKRQEEREEQRRIREEIREEEKAQREAEKAREEAEREEQRYRKALEKAREEAARATGAELAKLTKQMESFAAKLDEARQNKQRAISRAEMTKSGFVYVISNIGSFGEKVVKIGMTRRMEPMERIVELGDASVPFPFDLHAMMYSDNAPELEAALHRLLGDRRMNLVNSRKEFYRNVELAEIEAFVKTRGLSAQFIKLAEAKEYRETLAQREQAEARKPQEKFDGPLFETATA